jgi:hypothetical protein
MPGHGILPRRRLGHAAAGANAGGRRRIIEPDDPVEAEAAKVRNPQADRACDVAKRVASLVAVGGSVRQFAAANAVEHDQDDARERCQGWGDEK